MSLLDFYKGKRVFVTGHTGFKGAWLCRILTDAGAEVTGYALAPSTQPSLFDLTQLSADMHSVLGDVRDFDALKKAYDAAAPEIVFHLAAQPIVRESYRNPRDTYETNVMGTVNLLECVRCGNTARSVLNVTTDKVYENKEWAYGYRECDPLDGFDPYSNSKSCSELVTHSYKSSFLAEQGIAVSTARAGNVIGGGDFSVDRILPDCVRAMQANQPISVRNPQSIRPYQHVLEPLFAYLQIAEKQYHDAAFAGYYNVGPDDCDCINTAALVELFCAHWGDDACWLDAAEPNAPHEANFLKLDCSLLKSVFGWQPRLHIDDAVGYMVDWTRAWLAGENVNEEMRAEIDEYFADTI